MKIRLPKEERIKITNSNKVYQVMLKILMRQGKLHRKKEYFLVMGLDTANRIQYIELATLGVLNQVCLDPVEVFCFAVSQKCKRIIVIHNHPSGTLKPSKCDIEVTKKLKEGGGYLGDRADRSFDHQRRGVFVFYR